jgi:hypothetical protein
MPARVVMPAALAVLFTLVGSSVGVVSTNAAASPATARIVVRPVTEAGTPAPGVLVTSDQKAGTVDCRTREPSPGAVSRDIEFCTPSAAYAIACWKSATPRQVLCSRDPRSGRVWSLPRTGAFAPTGLAGKRKRTPLMLVLGNGRTCSIRDGGAWGSLKQHPQWYGTFSCDGSAAVWSPASAPHSGVNESRSTWTVHVGSISGNGPVTIRTVRKAYFVGTAQ